MDRNMSLIGSIYNIEESCIDSELDVLIALGSEYAKAGMIAEYANPAILSEYEVIQESSKDKDKNDGEKKKRGFFGTIWHGIKSVFKFIWKCIKTFFKWIGSMISKICHGIKSLFTKKKDDKKTDTPAATESKEQKELDEAQQRLQELYKYEHKPEDELIDKVLEDAARIEQLARQVAIPLPKNHKPPKDDETEEKKSDKKDDKKDTSTSDDKSKNTADDIKDKASKFRQTKSKEAAKALADSYKELRKIYDSIAKTKNVAVKDTSKGKPFLIKTDEFENYKAGDECKNIVAKLDSLWDAYVKSHKSDELKRAISNLDLEGKSPVRITKLKSSMIVLTIPHVDSDAVDMIKKIEKMMTDSDSVKIRETIKTKWTPKYSKRIYVAGALNTAAATLRSEMNAKMKEILKESDSERTYLDNVQGNTKMSDSDMKFVSNLLQHTISKDVANGVAEMKAYLQAVSETISQYNSK
jgi:hypothetical protein